MPTCLRLSRLSLLGVGLALCVGCATPDAGELRKCLGEGCERRLRSEEHIERQYRLGCRDVVEVSWENVPVTRVAVQPDGTIELAGLGIYRAEGRTPPEIEAAVAAVHHRPHSTIQLRVSGYHSARVYVFGLVKGKPRAVAYRGPERVTDLLQRLGGLDSGAALNDVHLIRSQVAEGKPPAVFHIDVRKILLNEKHDTNPRVQPGDQIYIGETKRSALVRLYPEWIRPTLNSFWLLIPSSNVLDRTPEREHDAPS